VVRIVSADFAKHYRRTNGGLTKSETGKRGTVKMNGRKNAGLENAGKGMYEKPNGVIHV